MKTKGKLTTTALAAVMSLSIASNAWSANNDLLSSLRADVVGVMTASGRDTVTYADTDQFDLDLRSGLAHKHPVVTVGLSGEVAATPQAGNPQRFDLRLGDRLQRWSYKVKDTGGRAVLCPANSQQGVLSFLLAVFRLAYPAIRQWKLYQPAKDYDMIVYVDKKTVAGAADAYSVPKVEFRYRWTDQTKATRTTLPCTAIQNL